MRIIRFLGNVALWIGALLGVVAGGVWVAGQLGWVQPLIVISGSMEPGIDTGDLLIDRNVATASVEPGDVLSLHSEMTGKLVTHRVTEIVPLDGATWEITMKGDANDEPDLETYVVGSSVLTPSVQIPGGGKVVSKLMEPAVALPILLALVALLGMSLLDEEPRRPVAKRKLGETDDAEAQTDPLDDLDAALAALGIDVDDLDAALTALGIDVGALDQTVTADRWESWPDEPSDPDPTSGANSDTDPDPTSDPDTFFDPDDNRDGHGTPAARSDDLVLSG